MSGEPESSPYGPCTSRPDSECDDCALAGRLACRFKRGDLLHFLGLFLTFMFPAVIGMVLGGYSWYVLGWLVLLVVLLGVVLVEERIIAATAMAQPDQWDAFGPTFIAMFNSLSFFEPEE